MKVVIITFRIEETEDSEGQPQLCVWWYLPGSSAGSAPDGGLCCAPEMAEGLVWEVIAGRLRERTVIQRNPCG